MKIGDKVKILNNGTAPKVKKGSIGEIINVEDEFISYVEVYFKETNSRYFFKRENLKKV